MLKEKNEIENYEEKSKVLRENGWETWYNDDKEGHTVTSGEGSGRFGWMSDNFGKPNGIFDSGRFMPGESWSYTFEDSGTFSYYCTIHPWMEGILIVEKQIPDYPHDATGTKAYQERVL